MKNKDQINPKDIEATNNPKSIPGEDVGYEMAKSQKDIPQPGNHDGSEELIKKYNINDQAHSNSSEREFIKTTSNFHHKDENKK
jgi:hypothetical protein